MALTPYDRRFTNAALVGMGLNALIDGGQNIERMYNAGGQIVQQGANALNRMYQSAGGSSEATPSRGSRVRAREAAEQRQQGSQNVRRRFNPESKNTSSTQMPSAGTQTSKAGHDDEEVPVMPVPSRVSKIMPDYFNITFPTCSIQYQVTTNKTQGSETIIGGIAAKTAVFLNTLNGCHVSGGGGPNSSAANGRGVSQFTNLYKYYRITQCDVRVTMWINMQTAHYPTNDDKLLVGFHLNDTPTAPNWETFRDFMEMKDGGAHLFIPGDGQNTPAGVTSLQYTYTPGSWKTHVTETGIAERWTPIGGSPPHPAYCHFGAVAADYFQYNTASNTSGLSNNAIVKFMIETIQHVQFREVKESILNDEQ